MPEQMGTHWSGSDEPDGYMDKFAATVVVAIVLMVVIATLLAGNIWASKLSAKTYSSRKPILFFDCFTVLLSVFLLVIYFAVLVWNAGADFGMLTFSYISAGVMAALTLAIPFYIFTRKSEISAEAVEDKAGDVLSTDEYKDKLIEISDNTIVFKNYYFPAGSKSIKLSQVEYVEEKRLTLRNGKWRLHGTGDLLFRIWFPADYDRPSRDKIFVMKVKGKWMQIGFTVENSYAVSELFRTKGLLQ